jgi:dienelactone hydrolase
MRNRALLVVIALLVSGLTAGVGGTTEAQAARPRAGTVVSWSVLDRDLWVPRATRRAYRVTYRTTNAHGRRARSTGTVFIPRGTPPKGGWPVLSWAHGTSGLGDRCAPSRIGPALPQRDWRYLRRWMREGYAVVASDYAGLGTRGLPAYLHGRSTAHNVVDMVKAGRRLTADRPRWQRLSRRWAVLGQSQGGGAAIYTARHATRFGGRGLDYRGAVGTGTPAYIEDYVLLLGPKAPPVAVSGGLASYFAYTLASLEDVHPELGIDTILTPEGRRVVDRARTACVIPFEHALADAAVGDWFTAPIASLPDAYPTLRNYLGMPERGFDRPFFMGHGVADLDVPIAQTARYVGVLEKNLQPVTFHTYPTDHSGTLQASLTDSVPFLRRLFRR